MVNPIQLIVGLGNPGRRYEKTRHNVGFWFVDALAERYNINLCPEAKFQGLIGKIAVNEHDCWLLLPLTYMNLSGTAVQFFAKFYKLKPQEMLIVHDELDFPPGMIKLKQGGGHGGHKGLQSIIASLGNKDFYRLRIGIGHPGDKDAVVDYVTHKPSKYDKHEIMRAIDRGLDVVPDIVVGDVEKAIHILHSGLTPNPSPKGDGSL